MVSFIQCSAEITIKPIFAVLILQDDGLQLTRGWLQRHAPPEEELSAAEAAAPADAARFLRLRVQRVLNDAFLELLEWDDDQACLNEMVMHFYLKS